MRRGGDGDMYLLIALAVVFLLAAVASCGSVQPAAWPDGMTALEAGALERPESLEVGMTADAGGAADVDAGAEVRPACSWTLHTSTRGAWLTCVDDAGNPIRCCAEAPCSWTCTGSCACNGGPCCTSPTSSDCCD